VPWYIDAYGALEQNPDAPNLIYDDRRVICGCVTHWNPFGLGEAIVQFFDGSADSAIFSELQFVNGREKAREYLNSQER
jgi:hypothetical protein